MSAAERLVLHGLRCIGFAGLARVADATGRPGSDVESDLIDLAVAGLVTYEPGPFGGWGLTVAGRAADAEWIAAELAATGGRAAARRAHEGFLVLNAELLDLCTAWQLRSGGGPPATNDHTDRSYDGRIMNQLSQLDQRAEATCAALCAALPRFRRYRDRLEHALARAEAGEVAYVADAMASYHRVWTQLHEDLLATLGISRHAEPVR
jgi:hypothetical protein